MRGIFLEADDRQGRKDALEEIILDLSSALAWR